MSKPLLWLLLVGLTAVGTSIDVNTDIDEATSLLQTAIVRVRASTVGGHREAAAAVQSQSSSARHPAKKGGEVSIVADVSFVESEFEYLAALLWLAMLGLLPFVCAYIRGEQLTRSRKIIGGFVMAWVVTCAILYTSVLHCGSDYWSGARRLTLIETLYFLTQILTTVGYGDIWPAYPSGQIVTALIVLWAIFIVADAVGQLAGLIFNRIDAEAQSDGGDAFKMQAKHLAGALASHFVLAAVGIAFDVISLGWTFEQAFFSSIITSTTVGFGVFTTASRGGQLFLSFWMLFSTASLANVVGAFGGLMGAIKDSEKAK